MLYSLLESQLRARCAGFSHFRSVITDQVVGTQKFHSTNNGSAFAANQQHFPSQVIDMLDRIMDKLHEQSLEFNSVVGWNLHVSATPPSFVTEAVEYNARRQPVDSRTKYRARLATRLWSLVARAYRCDIEFFLLPTANVMGLSKSERHYPAMMTLSFDRRGTSPSEWTLNGVPFEAYSTDRLATNLFKMLVHKCVNESMENMSDPFGTAYGACAEALARFEADDIPCASLEGARHHDPNETQEISFDEPEAPKIPAPRVVTIGEFMQRMRDQVEQVEANAAEANAAEANAAEAGSTLPTSKERKAESPDAGSPIMSRYDTYNDVLLAFTFLLDGVESEISAVGEQGAQSFRRRELGAIKCACIDLIAMQANEKRVMQLRERWLSMREVAETLSQHTTTEKTTRRRSVVKVSEDAMSSLNNLIDCVENVIETMSECGAESFASRNFALVDAFRQHAVSVIDFKTELTQFREEWSKPKKVLADAVVAAANSGVSVQTQPQYETYALEQPL